MSATSPGRVDSFSGLLMAAMAVVKENALWKEVEPPAARGLF